MCNFKKFSCFIFVFCVFCAFSSGVFAAYPERSINWIVTAPPGGGTDIWGRKLASIMEKTLGQKITVNNMVGAGGGTGTAYVWQAPHDGYTLCAANDSTANITVMTGMQETMSSNWDFFIAGSSPTVLCVNAESGFKDFNALLEAVKQEPGKIKVASSSGSVLFVLTEALIRYCGLPLGNIPIPGSYPTIISCVSGETVAVIASIGDVADFVKTGRLLPLTVMLEKDYEMPGYGTIPSIITALPDYEAYLPLKQWQGFMVPKDTPEDIKVALYDAFAATMKSEEIEELRLSQHAVFYNLSGKEALEFAAKSESVASWLLYDMNLTQNSPEKFGIPRQ